MNYDSFLIGMVCCGSRVIETMGSRISKMTPRWFSNWYPITGKCARVFAYLVCFFSLFPFSLGFTVVLTASVVVMVCSMAGIPTSTTHCQVKIKIISIIITILNLIVLVITFVIDHDHCFYPSSSSNWCNMAGIPISTTHRQVLMVITTFFFVPIFITSLLS